MSPKSVEFLVNFLVTVASQTTERSAQITLFDRSVSIHFSDGLGVAFFSDRHSDFGLLISKLVHHYISRTYYQEITSALQQDNERKQQEIKTQTIRIDSITVKIAEKEARSSNVENLKAKLVGRIDSKRLDLDQFSLQQMDGKWHRKSEFVTLVKDQQCNMTEFKIHSEGFS